MVPTWVTMPVNMYRSLKGVDYGENAYVMVRKVVVDIEKKFF
jgi:hypothetical protein